MGRRVHPVSPEHSHLESLNGIISAKIFFQIKAHSQVRGQCIFLEGQRATHDRGPFNCSGPQFLHVESGSDRGTLLTETPQGRQRH